MSEITESVECEHSTIDRTISIVADQIWIMDFDSSKLKDSEALHFLLSLCDPGYEYVVRFQRNFD